LSGISNRAFLIVPFPTPDGPEIITKRPRSLSFRIIPPFLRK